MANCHSVNDIAFYCLCRWKLKEIKWFILIFLKKSRFFFLQNQCLYYWFFMFYFFKSPDHLTIVVLTYCSTTQHLPPTIFVLIYCSTTQHLPPTQPISIRVVVGTWNPSDHEYNEYRNMKVLLCKTKPPKWQWCM